LGIVIAEFGWSPWYASSMSVDEEKVDMTQSIFLLSTLRELLKSIHHDGIRVAGAMAWSYLSNWEWGEYDDHFGLEGFNFTTLESYYKRSIFDLVDYIHGNLQAS
jgi:beta-glucosidase/6-phospho-beta-glucosidase/beta-galactosidase